jgi:2-methylcitrate dehydratase
MLTSLTQSEQGIAVWGIQRKADTVDAIFMNTILGRRSDLVNTYLSPNRMGGSHPSDNVPLVLSISDWLGKSGQEVITNTYVAYMLSCAFADYYNPEENRYDHDAAALFYLPLVIGSLMELSVQQMTEAQRIAGMMGLDINQAAMGEVTDWKHCTYASCALRALHSVKLALAGFEGPKEIYEGDAGINRFVPHIERMLDPKPNLGSIVLKRWPALVFCQTPIDVAIELAQQIADCQTIDRVEVQIYRKAIEEAANESSRRPVNRAGRTHSLPYCVAAALVKKKIDVSYFDDNFIKKEKELAGLIPRIDVVEDHQMTKRFPDGAPCRIIIRLKDGRTMSHYRDFPVGDPHDPLSDQDIEEKVHSYLSLLTDERKADAIIERIWNLEKEISIDWLVAPLKKRVLQK